MAGIFDPFIDIMQTPIGTIILIGLVAFGVYYVITRYFWKKEPDKFEVLTLEEVVIDRLDDLCKFKGLTTNSALVQGFDFLGDVDKWLRVKDRVQQQLWDAKAQQLRPYFKGKIPQMVDFDLYIFRIKKGNFLFNLLGIGKRFYAVVDAEHLANLDTQKFGFRQWNIKPNIMFYRWGGAYVTSDKGEQFLSNFSVIHSHENMKTYTQSYLKFLVHYYPAHAMKMGGYEGRKKIDSKAWERYKKADEYDDEDE